MMTEPGSVSSGGSLAPLKDWLVAPDDPAFDQARLAWNRAVDQHPAAVAFPSCEQDVVSLVQFASDRGWRVAPQGTGHNAGPLRFTENTVLCKTERMRQVDIDPRARTVRLGSGVLWGELSGAAAAHGLAGLLGSSADVGVVGYALGGGYSLIGRMYGLCANSVRAIELVTAHGRLVRCDAEHETDLFWALRGGGGSFGIVTALELELLPLERVYAGALFFPIEAAGEVLRAWRELTSFPSLPDELTTMGRLLRLPPDPELPVELRGQSFTVVHVYHVGIREVADELLAPLRQLGPLMDTVRSVPIELLTQLHMDPSHPVMAAGEGLLLTELPPNALDAFIEVATEVSDVPMTTIELRHLGGALAQADPQGGAVSSVDAEYLMFAAGALPNPECEGAVRAQIRVVHAALGPWAAPHVYLNIVETRMDVSRFWDRATYERLRQIKTSVDPTDVIRSNHPIPSVEPTLSGAIR